MLSTACRTWFVNERLCGWVCVGQVARAVNEAATGDFIEAWPQFSAKLGARKLELQDEQVWWGTLGFSLAGAKVLGGGEGVGESKCSKERVL